MSHNIPELQYTIELRDKFFDLQKILNKQNKRCRWEFNEFGGCGQGSIILAMPSSDIDDLVTPDAEIRIKIKQAEGEAETLYYRGFLDVSKPVDSTQENITLNFNGYSAKLKRVRVNTTYTNTEVSDIVKDILDTYVIPDYPEISYDSADIELTDFTPDSLPFDTDAASAIKTLRSLAGDYEWGIDRNLKFYFRKKSDVVEHLVKYKKDVMKYDEIDDFGAIVNRLVIKGSGSFEDTVNNTESQSAYNLRSKTISNASISSTSVSQRYGTGLLADGARIQRKVSVKHIKNNKLYEATLPLGKLAVVREPVNVAKKYADVDAIYGQFLYGGLASFKISRISYNLTNEGTNVDFHLGLSRPDISKDIEQLEFEIEQIRNA